MDFKQIYTPGVAHCSYVLGGESECMVIDPSRDVELYLQAAKELQLPITAIFETHLHADFVSGHKELAERTGATIYVSNAARVEYPHRGLDNGEVFQFDRFQMQMLDTPGHTPESSVLLVADTSRGPEYVLMFSGDTLLIGDAGRPDLFPEIQEKLAKDLYHSLGEIAKLEDYLEVYPAHGAGSLCGKALSSKLSSTLGIERRQNPAMKLHPVDHFVEVFLEDMPEVPDHFFRCSEINRSGASNTQNLLKPVGYAPKEFLNQMRNGAIVVDTRNPLAFASAHIPGAYALTLKGNFATFAGWVLPPDQSILLVADSKQDLETAIKGLYLVGLEKIQGYLLGGMDAYTRSGYLTEGFETLSVQALKERLDRSELVLIDTRLKNEFEDSHIEQSLSIPAPDIRHRAEELDAYPTIAFICNSGNRSLLAASLMLQKNSNQEIINVIGGTPAWADLGYPLCKEGKV